jgi:2-phosphosulfolactate phosphatase
MRIELTWTSLAVPAADFLAGRAVVAIDALRATSTIVTALANGAERIVPKRSVEEARAEAASRPGSILSGERFGLKVDRFDLGNSPLEYTPGAVAGKTIVMTTTNGTQALAASAGADEILCGALLNARAVASHLRASGRERTLIVCAGTDGEFSLDDAVTAGAIIDRIAPVPDVDSLSDSALAALILFRSLESDLHSAFLSSTHGRRLLEIGLGNDVGYCASVDTHDVVPVLAGDAIVPIDSPVATRHD